MSKMPDMKEYKEIQIGVEFETRSYHRWKSRIWKNN